MTYCLGIKINKGLLFMSDTRTNAGVDNISTFKKIFTFVLISLSKNKLQPLDAGNEERRTISSPSHFKNSFTFLKIKSLHIK